MPRLFSLLLVIFSSYSFAIDCPLGEVDKGGVCTSVCTILKGETRSYTYDAYIWGEKPTSACIGQYGSACVLSTESIAVSVDPTERMWMSTFKFTGQKCSRGDSFSGGTPKPFPYEGDANMNGIPDGEEDFDLDGIPNHSDPNPDKNDNLISDADGDNVPDDLEQHYQTLLDIADTEIVTFKCYRPDCANSQPFADSVWQNAHNRKKLVEIIDQLVRTGVSKSDVANALKRYNGELSKELNYATRTMTSTVGTLQNSVYRSMNQSIGVMRTVGNDLDAMNTTVQNQQQRFSDLENTLASTKRDISQKVDNSIWYTQRAEKAAKDAESAADGVWTSLSFAREDIEATRSAVESLAPELKKNTKAVNNFKKTVGSKLDSLDTKVGSLNSGVAANGTKLDNLEGALSSLQSSVDALPSGGNGNGNGDGTGQDYSGVLSGISNGISELKNAVTGENKFQAPSSDFDPNGLISSDAAQSLQSDIDSLREDMATQYDEFKNILSFDTESFNDGEYHEHVLDLTVNGEQRSFKTGVLTALLDNADIIKAVILFLFVLMGIRMLGGE
ncbi:hypothetical protein F2P58_20150 [Vibrio fortis]|uniref:Chemotaxis protein n=1 Tax=Vibrio fortis TaxID=212667 RepID=A0A5N3QXS1_9VIBR|nr:hypothetical protein [Vibrio fortis]KAB0286947.1 hypothetical protein F2P58_20150 [Vibrio fortis]